MATAPTTLYVHAPTSPTSMANSTTPSPAGFDLSTYDLIAMIVIPIVTLVLICVALRFRKILRCCKCSTKSSLTISADAVTHRREVGASSRKFDNHWQIVKADGVNSDEEADDDDVQLLPFDNVDPNTTKKEDKVLVAGEVSGDYSHDWRRSFDAVFLAFMVITLVALSVATQVTRPELWGKGMFWLDISAKFGTMTIVSMLGGLL